MNYCRTSYQLCSVIPRLLGIFLLVPILFIPLFLSTVDARMIDDEAEIRYLLRNKFMLSGEVSVTYERLSEQRGDSPSFQRYGLTEDLQLKFRSYIYHPAMLTYTAELDWRNSSGDYGRGNARSYGLNLDFFRTKPLRFSLRANYIDGDDYSMFNQGVSVSYVRRRDSLVFTSMRAASLYAAMQRQAMKNTGQNNAGPGDDDSEESNNSKNTNNSASAARVANTNNNAGNNNNNDNNDLNNRKASKAAPQYGFFDNIAPTHLYFDLDRYDYRSSVDSRDRFESYLTSARILGSFLTASSTTSYQLHLGYSDFVDKGILHDSQNKYDSSFDLITDFSNKSKFTFNIKYELNELRRESFNNLFSRARYDGFFRNRTWTYAFTANYDRMSSDSITLDRYLFTAEAGSKTTFGRIQTRYNFGLKYDNGTQGGNYAVFARADAGMPVNDRLTLSAQADIDVGTDVQSYSLLTSSRYLLSKQSALTASYAFRHFSGNRPAADIFTNIADTPISNTSHSVKLGYSLFLSTYSFDTSAEYNKYNDGSSMIWDNLFATTFFNRVGFNLGAKLIRQKNVSYYGDYLLLHDRISAPNGTTTYVNVYNTITYSPWRNSSFRVYSTYQKILTGSRNAEYSIAPSFTWRLRKLLITLEYKYSVTYPDDIKTREERLMIRLTRPFWM